MVNTRQRALLLDIPERIETENMILRDSCRVALIPE